MSTTDAPARPDLSHLDADEQFTIEVAETQGWEVWHYASDDCAMLFRAGHFDRITEPVFVRGSGGKRVVPAPGVTVPQFLTDPAAWGALMEREMAGHETAFGEKRCWWVGPFSAMGGTLWHFGPWAPTIGRAVCLAVLAKHGRDTSPYTEDRAA